MIVCQFWEEMQFFYSWFSILRRHFHTIEIHYPKNVKKLNTEIIFLSLPQTSLGFIDHWNAPVEVNCKGFIGPYDLHFKVGQKQWLVNKRNWISSGLYEKIIHQLICCFIIMTTFPLSDNNCYRITFY